LLVAGLSHRTEVMRRLLPRLLFWGAIGCLTPVHASAQEADSATRDAARSLGLSGIDAYQAGDYISASNRLEKAYALINVPSLGLWSARALAKRNLLVEAAGRYFEVASLQVPQGDLVVQREAQVEARRELEQLRPRIPQLVMRVEGAEGSKVALVIDGQAVAASVLGKPRLMNPGPHRVQAHVGSVTKSASVESVLDKETRVTFDFGTDGDATKSGGSARRTWGWIGVGAGGVGIALGAVMGGLAVSKRSQLKEAGCTDSHCPHDQAAGVQRLDTFRMVSTIGFIAGGVLATSGVVLLFTTPSSKHQLAATASADSVTLMGRF
jgi:hypothetical protein